MKKRFICLLSVFAINLAYGQVGINTDTPKSTIDVVGKATSTSPDGLIAPRITRAQLSVKTAGTYGTDQTGTIIYVSDVSGGTAVGATVNVTTTGYYFFDGAIWQRVTTGTVNNIYSADGTLAGNRTVTMSGRTLGFTGGNVGIGVANPLTTLHVAGTIRANRIEGPSDIRFKKDIKVIGNASAIINHLHGYTYSWKDKSEFPNQTIGVGNDLGVIAQEVEKVLPQAVTTSADGYKAVNYQALIPVLLQAFKEQQIRIENLESQVKEFQK